MRRVIIRWVPGFSWVQLAVSRKWTRGSWWAVRGIAKTRALGPFRIITMREDCVARALRPGGEFYKEEA